MGLQVHPHDKSIEDLPAFNKRFEVGKFLAKGGYGDVWECKDRASQEDCACKVYTKATLKTKEEKSALQKEILILKAVKGQHKGLVQLKEVLEGDRATCLVMENCKGGDMFELLSKRGRLPEKFAKMVFKQLASALRFCHSHGIVHRDIKLENILFNRPATCLYDPSPSEVNCIQAKIADFGLSVVLEPGDTTTGHVGSKFYTAPEILEGKRYGRRVDIWSLGVVLCAMLTGRLPFTGKNFDDTEGLKKAILRGKVHLDSSLWEGVSEEAKGLVRKMLELEPKYRIRACEILSHPWLLGHSAGSGARAAAAAASTTPLAVRAVQSMEVRSTGVKVPEAPAQVTKPHVSAVFLPLEANEDAAACLVGGPVSLAKAQLMTKDSLMDATKGAGHWMRKNLAGKKSVGELKGCKELQLEKKSSLENLAEKYQWQMNLFGWGH